jgi:hypothetical protein
MNKLTALLAFGTVLCAGPAAAHDTTTAFPSRGACESASADMSQGDKDRLLATAPQFFDTMGDVSSFLTRAWTCDIDQSDGQWYIKDHRFEVLNSDWFKRRRR